MGCYQSKMENEEAITRCKDRHYFMKQAVSSRNNFAAAHSSYAASLKNAGAALIDFAQGEQQNFQLSPPYDVPLPPPPLPDLPAALRRAITMPDFESVETTGLEEVDDDDDVDEEIVEGCGLSRRVKKSENMNMIQVLSEVDNHFIMASESAREVSVILQATRLHYHSNFSNTTGGQLDYSARVMRVVTWDRSFRETPNMDEVKDDFDSEKHETLATVLDKLLAWEKKLYNQVKAAELTKSEYQRKVITINKVEKRGKNIETLEKEKAALSHLDSVHIVDMQLLDSTISEINLLRDQQLYQKLVHLVDGMATMWGTMHYHYKKQLIIMKLVKSLDSQFPTETSEHHHDRTYQLLNVMQELESQFEKLVNNQKGFIKALYSWLKLNLTLVENDIKEKISSPAIQILLHAWNDHLEKLSIELVWKAISHFVAVIDSLYQQQQEELILKRKCEEMQKELARKSRRFDQWECKYKKKKRLDEFDANREQGDDSNEPDEVVKEKRVLIELEKRLDEEKVSFEKQCLHVRQKSLVCLKNNLAELLRAMTDFSLECSKMYSELRIVTHKLRSAQSS
ncbi:nitrate regulatory gene2 protein-like [Vicia villosa]|uniref:nitrate regulatory gene2 protein-like n=1 Tax=Vicia villosa TaxID=3911 RepID=UPI00273B332F|nr:nitrate regulatory gene2 protein-like [Vicia villosa]